MNDRVLSALRGLGIEGAPSAVLEREDAFFALLGDMLVYQDQHGTRRVTLRDLTRIHSDQDGLLRVETPAGTALTASLLGFNPGQVQGFFAQVRDATARAKNLPAAPLPAPGTHKTFGSMPKPSAPPAAPASPTTLVIGAAPEAREVREERPASPQPTAAPAAQPATVLRATPASPSVDQAPAPTGPAPTSKAREIKPEPAPSPAAPASPGAESLLTGLAARADAVSGLVSRLQLLAAVLGLAAVGLAFFQYRANAGLNGLWTLIAGGVGCIALLTFADVTRLLVALARAVARGGKDTARGGNRNDDGPT